jgi:hypothetical protein
MKRTNRGVTIALVAGALMGCASSGGTTYEAAGTVADPTSAELRLAMRKLWAEHVMWTRDYIVAAVADHPSAQAVSARLLRNQEDIGNAIAPYYGADAAARLTALLKDHIMIAVDLVSAAKAGDMAKKEDAARRWNANASDIATFLSGANPNWPRQPILDMLNDHLALTTQEAVARLERRWENDIALFDRIFTQSQMMADALTDGIVRQFPARF